MTIKIKIIHNNPKAKHKKQELFLNSYFKVCSFPQINVHFLAYSLLLLVKT